MANNCSYKLDANWSNNCPKEDPVVGGINAVAFINLDDLQGLSISNNIATASLASSAVAYYLNDPRTTSFNGSQKEMVTGEAFNKTTKTLSFVYYDKGVEAGRIMDTLKGGKFYVLLENTDGTREIWGTQKPVQITAYTQSLAGDDDTVGAYVVTAETTESADTILVSSETYNQLISDAAGY